MLPRRWELESPTPLEVGNACTHSNHIPVATQALPVLGQRLLGVSALLADVT